MGLPLPMGLILPTDENIQLSDIITNDVSITKHGFAPKLPNDATKFLNGTGEYSVPNSNGGSWGSISGTLSDQTDLQNKLNELFLFSNSF